MVKLSDKFQIDEDFIGPLTMPHTVDLVYPNDLCCNHYYCQNGMVNLILSQKRYLQHHIGSMVPDYTLVRKEKLFGQYLLIVNLYQTSNTVYDI